MHLEGVYEWFSEEYRVKAKKKNVRSSYRRQEVAFQTNGAKAKSGGSATQARIFQCPTGASFHKESKKAGNTAAAAEEDRHVDALCLPEPLFISIAPCNDEAIQYTNTPIHPTNTPLF
ncbi:hypothetical protein V5799_028990 [Amblyomma americanum]|uniref:Uncharacterized protein n=1 Tax=Amblyomma americanum TaxID=6943 RepID=A0AAQ4ESP0_AMBAM